MKMPLDVAKASIDWIFDNVPSGMSEVEISFIGGEPLLEFDLIKDIIDYTRSKERKEKYVFFATTNGTLLTDTMKEWFDQNNELFVLGLCLDGNKLTHDHNRSNSFGNIDLDFFKRNWPYQTVKMTLSDFSLCHLSDNIKYIHSHGFKIAGVNLGEGDFDWGRDEYIKTLVPQLKELVKYYIKNDTLPLNQMFDKKLHYCEFKEKMLKKWCGIGIGTPFFDIDGKIYPCTYVTPMTYPFDDIETIKNIDFTNESNFLDEDCYNNCYIYPICPTCAGANYFVNKDLKTRDKRKCKIQQLIALFIADLTAKRIIKDRTSFDDGTLHYTIKAIQQIRELYLKEFEVYFK